MIIEFGKLFEMPFELIEMYKTGKKAIIIFF